jgi:signal transduction histidine kinase
MVNSSTYTDLPGRWRLAARLSWLLVVLLALGLFAAGLPGRYGALMAAAANQAWVLADLDLSPQTYARYLTALDLFIVLTHLAIALVIFWRKAGDWLALFVSLTLVVTPLTVIDAFPALPAPGNVLVELVSYLGLVSSIILLSIFPTGQFVPGWTRLLAALWAMLCAMTIFLPAMPFSFAGWPSMLRGPTLLAVCGAGVYAQLYRFSRLPESLRQQVKWAAVGLAGAALGPIGYFLPFVGLPSQTQSEMPYVFYQMAGPAIFRFALALQLVGVTLFAFALLLFPLSLAVAILRHHLWDIDFLLNRTLVYGGLTGIVAGLYILIVGLMGALFQTRGNLLFSIVATGLIAVLFQPLQQRLQQAVNRLMYGERDDPAAVLLRLGERLESNLTAPAVLPALVETIGQALKLPYTAILLPEAEGERIAAAHPPDATPGKPVERFPLVYRGETVGQLLATPHFPGDTFAAKDRRLLNQLARQAGPAVQAARLTADLQRSRERLVTAREEERRRLRRDLHDGLGPQLASLTLKLDAVRNLLAHDPVAADQLLLELKGQTQSAITGIRRVVYNLRPPALDQLGLLPAIHEFAAQHSVNGLQVSVEGPKTMPSLPAAVEVAAYHITLEAITNVDRHAGAQQCQVCLSLADALELQISDDGVGLPMHYQAGVGLTSMRERTEELGGRFTVGTISGGGTRVSVSLPVRVEQGSEEVGSSGAS